MAPTNRIYITEYRDVAHDAAGNPLQCGQEPPVAEQFVAIAGTSAQSAAFNDATNFVSIYADSDCHIAFGDDPDATQDLRKMGAGTTMFCGVKPGHKVAVINEAT